MWDPVVFNREYKPRKDPTKKENEHRNNFQNKFKKFNILEHIDDVSIKYCIVFQLYLLFIKC